MAEYNFRIRFVLPNTDYLIYDGSEVEIGLWAKPVKLTLTAFAPNASGVRHLVLKAGPFPSAEDAGKAGLAVRNALLMTAVQLRMGIDVGQDESPGGITTYFREKVLQEQGVQLLDDVHGLCVYEADRPVRFFGSYSPTLIRRSPVNTFVEQLVRWGQHSLSLTEKQHLAFELYSAAHFEPLQRARFLTLVIALEPYSNRPNAPPSQEPLWRGLSPRRKARVWTTPNGNHYLEALTGYLTTPSVERLVS